MANRLYLGIEIGGTKLQVGAGQADGSLLGLIRRRVSPERGAAGIREQIVEAVGTLKAALENPRFVAAGIGFGGPIDAQRGLVTLSNQIGGWAGFALADWARQALGIPTVVTQNDADTAALGEARFGAGRGVDPLLYVTVGSGIGGGLILSNQIYRGAGRGAVEIGHLWIDPEPGDFGESSTPVRLEQIASGWGIGEAARALARRLIDATDPTVLPLAQRAMFDPEAITTVMVSELASAGDPLCRQILERAARAMGTGLAHAISLLAPERVVLGGGVCLAPEALWLEPVRATVERKVFAAFRGGFDIVTASLGEAVVIHGALALAADAARLRPNASRRAGLGRTT